MSGLRAGALGADHIGVRGSRRFTLLLLTLRGHSPLDARLIPLLRVGTGVGVISIFWLVPMLRLRGMGL